MLKLYSYFRSSASYRARIALNWKNLEYEYISIHLLKEAQRTSEFRKINPMGHVPALDHDGFLVSETMAILQYLDDMFPQKRLFPTAPHEKAKVLQICEIVNSGIQPLQNLKVQKVLEGTFGLPKAESDSFVRYWIQDGLSNLEKVLEQTAGSYCFGGEVTAADCFVIPQLLTAGRFSVDVAQFPNLSRVNANATALDAFKKAHPSNQPDYSG